MDYPLGIVIGARLEYHTQSVYFIVFTENVYNDTTVYAVVFRNIRTVSTSPENQDISGARGKRPVGQTGEPVGFQRDGTQYPDHNHESQNRNRRIVYCP